MRNKRLTARIVFLRGLGYIQRDIARKVGVNPATVNAHLKYARMNSEAQGAEQYYATLLATMMFSNGNGNGTKVSDDGEVNGVICECGGRLLTGKIGNDDVIVCQQCEKVVDA